MTLNDCKGKLTNLRITFNSNLDKYRKKLSGEGASESCPITWKYFKPILFLEATKVLQSTQSELNSAVDDESFLLDLGKSNTLEFASPSPIISDTSRGSSLKQMAVEALRSIRSQPTNATTALCDYMASELQNFTPEQAAFARSKLRRTFTDIMDNAALTPSSRNEQQQQQIETDSEMAPKTI